ncbi:FtsX-like permease family protein [Agromyces sp. NPDC058126]|uniref:FtsX-like permease family protein n=1 Tax=Agromyces sp. NPDC058126 TaxID=3346350 RepID=UPI0036D7A831
MVREAAASALAAPVASILIAVMIAGMCAAVLLTSGRTVGAEQAVIGSIDSAGTRSIVIRASAEAGLDSAVLSRIANVDGIEWAGAFGPAVDVQNAAFPGGTKVAMRLAYGDDWGRLGIVASPFSDGGLSYASSEASSQLGMPDATGRVSMPGLPDQTVGGPLVVPDFLSFLQPVLIAPQPVDAPTAPVSLLIVIAERPDLVAPVSAAVASVLAAGDPTQVNVETSEKLATLRALIEGQLGTFGRSLTLGILAVTAMLAATILYGTVTLRRKDFGRRRALGASQSLIIGLLLAQTAMLAAIGALIGSTAALAVLGWAGDPSPGWEYALGVAVLAVAVAVIAAMLPAFAAARREPISELRVP